jgi:hypothetical protein
MSIHEQTVKIIDADTPSIQASINQRGSVGAQVVELVDANGNAITSFPAGLAIPEHDDIQITYDDDGNIATVVYFNDGATVATLTLTYTSGNLTRIIKS